MIIIVPYKCPETIKQIEGAFKRFLDKKDDARALIKTSFLSEDMQQAYINVLEQRYEVLIKE